MPNRLPTKTPVPGNGLGSGNVPPGSTPGGGNLPPGSSPPLRPLPPPFPGTGNTPPVNLPKAIAPVLPARLAPGAGKLAPLLGKLAPFLLPLAPVIIPALLEPFAPGVRDWLRRGWRGTPGYGIPDSSRPGRLPFGHRAVAYTVTSTQASGQGNCTQTATSTQTVIRNGPIVYSEVALAPTMTTCNPALQTTTSLRLVSAGNQNIVGVTRYNPANVGFLTYTAIPLDGLPEGGEDPNAPPVITPYVPTATPKPQEPSFHPSPLPGGQPGLQPLPVVAPGLLPPFPGSPGGSPIPQPAFPPDISPDPGIAPSPNPSAGAAPAPAPAPVPPPSSAPSPPSRPTAPEEECDNPCALRTAKGVESIQETLEELLEQMPGLECPDQVRIPIPIATVTCNEGEPLVSNWVLILNEAAPAGFAEAIQQMATAAAKGCTVDPIATIPDWWQVRIGGERPQVVVAYRYAATTTYHSIAIPHPQNINKWTENLLGNYQKGSYAAILTLKDNSKFIINCATEAEAERMLQKAKTLISPNMLFNPSNERITLRKGESVSMGQMAGRNASYYSTGQRNLKPEWRTSFPL